MVKVTVPMRPSGAAWIDQIAERDGIDRLDLIRALIAKGAAAYRAGWRPDAR